jgi:hypothetical protein
MLSGFTNPVVYIFDYPSLQQGILKVRFSLPYSDLESLSEEERKAYLEWGNPLEWSHTLDDQIGGQLDAGFVLAGFYEDYDNDPADPLRNIMPTFIATRAVKLGYLYR